MTLRAGATITVSLLTVAVELALATATVPAWSPGGVQPLLLVFLAGPPLFLALLAWRRRTHPTRSRLLFRVALLVASIGIGILAYDYVRFRGEPPDEPTPHMHPPIVALGQWLAVLAVWVVLVVREGREKK